MSTITQRIPNLLLGISQQPDNRKFPGQLKDSVNAYPDYALGLLKRPGGQYIQELDQATTSGKWFSILRDQQEKYVAQYDENKFKVWSLIDSALGPAGSPRAVDMGDNAGVPDTCSLVDYLTVTEGGTGLTDGTVEDLATATTGSGTGLTVDITIESGAVTSAVIVEEGSGYADGDVITLTDGTYVDVELAYQFGVQSALTDYNTAVSTTATRLAELHTAQADYAEKLAGQDSTFQPVFEVRYNYEPVDGDGDPIGITIPQYLYSGIIQYYDETYLVRNNDVTVGTGATLPAGYTLGKELTAEYPTLVTATAQYNLGPEYPTVTDQNFAVSGIKIFEGILETAAANTQAELDDAETAMDTAQSNYDAAVTAEAAAKTIYDSELTLCDVDSLPAASLTVTAAGTGFTEGTVEDVATDEASSGATGLTVDLVINASGEVESATINTNPGTYLANDTITLPDYAGVTLTYNNEAYLRGATADDIELLTLNDYTFVLNKAKAVKYKADLTPTRPSEAFAVVRIVGTGHYRIYLNDVLVGDYNAGTGGDVDAIIGALNTDIQGATAGGVTFSSAAVGPGLHIQGDGDFTVKAVGGPSEDALLAFTNTIPTVADLPLQCSDGYLVKVVNSTDVDVDDMWVKFVSDNDAVYGTGVWEETTAPGIQYVFDELTMPHQLVRQADGSFRFDPVSWENRLIGDQDANLDPSFIGQKINNLFFYRNRLGFLSNEAVVLSRAGDYFNFWPTTALSVVDDDPIDITASSVRPVNHRFVRPTSVGLVLFSDTEQFILTTDADILSPKTAKINEMSSYECDSLIESVSLGTSQVFVSKTPLYTRLYELNEISSEKPPIMTELTKIVPELVPETITNLIASPALSLVSLGTAGSSTVYQYKFLEQPGQGRAQAWYKWELTGNLLDQFFDNNIYYTVVDDGTNVFIQSYDLTQANEEGFLTLSTGERTDICLDNWNINPYREYDPDADGSDITRIYLPFDHIAGKTFSVVVLGGYIGDDDTAASQSVGAVLYPTVTSAVADTPPYYVDISGDYRGRDLITGYVYDMEVTLPKFFVSSTEGQSTVSDFTSDLIIHRIKVSTGLSGPVKYQVTITGRPEWDKTVEAVTPNAYDLNSVNMSADAIHTVPIYQRNENLTFKIIGDTPFPVSLLSLNWEGKYNTGFYRRS